MDIYYFPRVTSKSAERGIIWKLPGRRVGTNSYEVIFDAEFPDRYTFPALIGRNAALTEEDAIAIAKQLHMKKVRSMERQLASEREIEFRVCDEPPFTTDYV